MAVELLQFAVLIPVAYAANAQAGLLKLFWGEARLLDDMGRVDWVHCEQIPLLSALPWVAQGLPVAEPDVTVRFDRGAEPGLTLVRRPEVERENAMIFPVDSEAPDERPIAGADERP